SEGTAQAGAGRGLQRAAPIGPLPVRRSGAAETAVRLAGGTCAESGQRSGQRPAPAWCLTG
ncbi:hypothetical protein, partial [Pantoea sp.]|uniref:hypothetical protein n=1 Tax=Pantoea sp. TaxID=69393 RepID=UPI0031E113D9